MTSFNNMGPHTIIIGCWELNFNMSLHVQLLRAYDCYIPRAHKTRVECYEMLG
jgi:hypothetical protein